MKASKPRRRRLPAAARADMARTRQVAKNEMAIGLMSVFRPLPDGAVRREVMFDQKFADWQVRIHGVEMNIFEQGIFLSILALAGDGVMQTAMEAGMVPKLPDNSNPNAPRDAKPEDNTAALRECVKVNTSIAELCRMAGIADAPGGQTRAAIKAAFSRLAMLTVFAQDGRGKWGITHLISGGLGSDQDGKVSVWLNPRSTRAVLGERAYAPVSMQVWRELPSQPAKALYAWLCAWFAGGTGTRQISMDALEIHVFGALAKSKPTKSRRRKEIRVALAAIEQETTGEIAAMLMTRGEKNVTITRQFTKKVCKSMDNLLAAPKAELGAKIRPARNHTTPSAIPHQSGASSASQYPCVFHGIGQCSTDGVLVAATSSSQQCCAAERLHCCEKNQKPEQTPKQKNRASNPHLPVLDTAACPAPAGATGFGLHQTDRQPGCAENGALAGLDGRTAIHVPAASQKPATGDSDAIEGHSWRGGEHG